MAKPQPKPGWTLSIERVPLDRPIDDHGKLVHERVSAVIWRGRLADREFDQFGILMRLPQETGLLYFRTIQSCEKGALRWTDIPMEGQAWHDLPRPAPVLRIEGADSGHRH